MHPIKRELLVDLEPGGFGDGDKRAAEDIKATGEQTQADPEGFILIVEDNKDMVEFLLSLVMKDYRVAYACSGAEALEKLESIPKPDLIISDVMMPHMDGHAFYHAIQAKEAHRDIPFIFLTARTTPEERVKNLSRGAIDYIYKPF